MSPYLKRTEKLLERCNDLPYEVSPINIALIPDIILEHTKLLVEIKEDGKIKQSDLPDNLILIKTCLKNATNGNSFNQKQSQYECAKRLLVEDLTILLSLFC